MLFRFQMLVAALFLSLAAWGFAAPEEIEVLAGFDGANPQSQGDILRESPTRFRVKPFNEEGSNDSYYFRFNTKVVNHGTKTTDVEFLVEWPVLERQPGYPYDTYYYGEKGNWHWTFASVRKTTAQFSVPVPPGTTYVGYYPRYSYGQFEDFISGLAQTGKLKKWVEGKTMQGRNIWCLKITDPAVPDQNKRSILITARNHPYESSGSYIVEDIVGYLQGDTPQVAKLLRENIVHIIPMLNPDGVALGCNQRTRSGGVNMSFGSDTDDPSVLTLLKFVQRERPGLWVDIHSWPHKGDDGMWCTHQWVADGLLAQLPNKSFQDYVWDVTFVKEGSIAENHLWRWLIRTFNTGGVSLSFSWYRRTEEDMKPIGIGLINTLCTMKIVKPQ